MIVQSISYSEQLVSLRKATIRPGGILGGQVNTIRQPLFCGRSHCSVCRLKCKPFWHACCSARPLMQRTNCSHEPSTGKLAIGLVAGQVKHWTLYSQSHSRVAGLNNHGLGHVPEIWQSLKQECLCSYIAFFLIPEYTLKYFVIKWIKISLSYREPDHLECIWTNRCIVTHRVQMC